MENTRDDKIKELESENEILKERLAVLEDLYKSKEHLKDSVISFLGFKFKNPLKIKKGDKLREEIEKTQAAIDAKILDENKNQNRNYRNFLFFGILIGIAVSGSFLFYWKTVASSQNIVVAILIVLVGSLGIGLFLFFWFKHTLLFRFFKVTQASYEVIVENVFNALLPVFRKNESHPSSEVANSLNALKEATKQIAAYVAYRRTWQIILGFLIALAAGLAGYLGTVLIWQQNKLIKEQTYLSEASRRSSLILMMSNIMDRVDGELNGNDILDQPFHPSRVLSDLTIGRLAALSQSMKTINYLENDSIIISPISPERGQLLMALANSRLDTMSTYRKIFSSCTFQYSDLKDANLDSLYLVSANLRGSNLSRAFLRWGNLEGIDLVNAKLEGANLSWPNLRQAKLNNANLDNSTLFKADMRGADLTDASLVNSDLSGALMQNSLLNEANLQNANLNNTQLSNAKLSNVNLQGANLKGATLLGSDLSYANFANADLSGALLHNATRLVQA